MATGYINNKSQQINARIPHDVVEEMDECLLDDETRAKFIIAAVRTEIKRRQKGKKASNTDE
ncbi:YlcI/YnfO family protein [Buttiauxella gaviniae]|uniref:YlcI/YnfO family protein n=1 Tax=Buttiauxella gaviniae TaxID=82990 RepID=A0ABV3NTN8_9ENTR